MSKKKPREWVSRDKYIESHRSWALKVSKAKRCIRKYMKDVHGREDGLSPLAISDFAREKGYIIPSSKTNARWLTELYFSGRDSDLNESSQYNPPDKEVEEFDYREFLRSNAEKDILSQLHGEHILDFYKDQALIRGCDWYDVYASAFYRKAEDDEDDSESLTHKQKYYIYLRSEKWKTFKSSLIEQRGLNCEKCGKNGSLDAHHLTYERIFNELPEDIILLCKDCHKKEHSIK